MNQFVKLIIASIALVLSVSASCSEELEFIEWEGQRTILFNGPFLEGTSDRLKAFLNENSERKMIMNSPGGIFTEGIATGEIIREMGVIVHIPSRAVCISACAFAAIASEEINIEGIIAFHRPYYDQEGVPESQIMSRKDIFVGGHVTGQIALHYLMQMGFSPTFSGYVMANTSEEVFLIIKKTVELLPLVVDLDSSLRQILDHSIPTDYLTSMTYTQPEMAMLYTELNQETGSVE